MNALGGGEETLNCTERKHPKLGGIEGWTKSGMRSIGPNGELGERPGNGKRGKKGEKVA